MFCRHVFISYRTRSDRQLARQLYDELSKLELGETGQKLRVYLDQTRLEDGQRWDSGFMEGLANSWVVVPIVSVGSIGPMCELVGEGSDDVDVSASPRCVSATSCCISALTLLWCCHAVHARRMGCSA
eukprot:SAG22_NODE_33_length_27588_cov_104.174652_9_plen_128_part_00